MTPKYYVHTYDRLIVKYRLGTCINCFLSNTSRMIGLGWAWGIVLSIYDLECDLHRPNLIPIYIRSILTDSPFKNLTKFTSNHHPTMCPHETADVLPTEQSEMVQVPLTNGKANGKRGTSRSNTAHLEQQRRNPYAPRAADFLSNISNFNIIESTLRGIFYTFNARIFIADFLIFQRVNNSPTPFSTPRLKSPLPRASMRSVWSTSSSHPPQPRSSLAPTAKPFASSA